MKGAWRLANRRVVQLQSKIARQRLDFHHKESAKMVGTACAAFMKTLHVAHMTQRPTPKKDATTGQYQPNGAAAKATLNKAILDGAPAQFLSMVRYKAAEAGIVYTEAPTRHLKPSQRCHTCWMAHKKRLDERWHTCPWRSKLSPGCQCRSSGVALGHAACPVRLACLVVAS